MVDIKIQSLVLVNILSNIWYAVIVPFLPIELNRYDLPIEVFGYIFAIYALASMLASLFVGKLLVKFGRKTILTTGIFSMGICMLGFSCIDFIQDKKLLVLGCLVMRWLQGISSSMIQTTSYAIVTVWYPEEKKKYLGIIETAIGIGLCTGPMIGSLLYSYLGFKPTFYIIGFAFEILGPILYFAIPSSIDAKDSQHFDWSKNSSGVSSKLKPVGYISLLTNPKFLINTIVPFLAYFNIIYPEPVLALRVLSFGVPPYYIGILVSVWFVGYTISSIWMTHPYLQETDSKKLILIGLISWGAAHLLMGPAIFLPNKLWIIGFGQFFVGMFTAFLLIPSLPEMIKIANQLYPHQKIESSDLSSGIFNSMLGLGQMVGPIFGSYMTSIFSFRTCGTLASAILLGFWAIYFFIEFKRGQVESKEILLELGHQKLILEEEISIEDQKV